MLGVILKALGLVFHPQLKNRFLQKLVSVINGHRVSAFKIRGVLEMDGGEHIQYY